MAGENITPEDETPVGETTPEVNTPSLLDSINAALAPTLPEPPADDNAEGDTDEDDSELGEGEEGDADETGEGTAPRNADGTFKSPADGKDKAGEGAAKTGDGKPGDGKLGPDGKPLAADKGSKADPVNDPIPDEVKGRTRERMQSLIATVKEKDEMIGIQNQLYDSIKDTGATPEEFGAMLGYMRWVHSDKPEDLKQARELLMHELEGISLKLGEAAPGIDFLSKFPDLQEKVNNGQLTVDDANEMALHRQRTKVTQDRTTAQRTQDEQTQEATRARDAGIAELNALGKTLSSTDPEFETKHEILKPVINALGQLPPGKWKAAFTQAYKAITPAQIARWKATGVVTPPAAGGAGKTPQNQPLRANKSPSGGQARQATSLLDAVSNAVDSVDQG